MIDKYRYLAVLMLCSITLNPYSIPNSSKFISSANPKIAPPERSTELQMAADVRTWELGLASQNSNPSDVSPVTVMSVVTPRLDTH